MVRLIFGDVSKVRYFMNVFGKICQNRLSSLVKMALSIFFIGVLFSTGLEAGRRRMGQGGALSRSPQECQKDARAHLRRMIEMGDMNTLRARFAGLPEQVKRRCLGEQYGKRGKSLLHIAASARQIKAMRFLVEIGLGVDTCDRDRCTALHHAVAGDDEGVVRCLLGLGANFKAKNREGWIPSDLARSQSLKELLTQHAQKFSRRSARGNRGTSERALDSCFPRQDEEPVRMTRESDGRWAATQVIIAARCEAGGAI